MADTVPEPTGPYQIGVAQFDLFDPSRRELEYPQGRLIPVMVYFPMQKGPHAPRDRIGDKRAPDPWEALKVKVHSQRAELDQLADGFHPVVILNHAKDVTLADYAFLAEDLSSHGYVVLSIQHQLLSDPVEPAFWKEGSISRNARVIDNILFVFEWLKESSSRLFVDKMDLKRIGLIGHSMGANSLLLLANRNLESFSKRERSTLLPREDQEGVRECLIVMETTGFPYPLHGSVPLFFLLSEQRESYQKQTGCYDKMVRSGHKVRYYKGATHISFMDRAYFNPPNLFAPGQHYFNGTDTERASFFDEVRQDVRAFLEVHLKT